MRQERWTRMWVTAASAGRPAAWYRSHLDEAAVLRQNAAVLLREARLTPITNPSLSGINRVNLHFHWDLPRSNIC